MKKARIAVVDDHPIVRHGIVRLLEDSEDLCVCGQASQAKEVMPLLEEVRPALLLLDLFLRGSIAIELIRKIRAAFPKLPILIFSIQNEALFAERTLQAGADGYVVKEEATEELLQAIQALLAGRVYVSKNIVDRMSVKVFPAKDSQAPKFVSKLSDREIQILKLLGDGVSIREAAEDLEISAKTIETHCARIKKKLQLRNGNELLRFAVRWQSDLSGISR